FPSLPPSPPTPTLSPYTTLFRSFQFLIKRIRAVNLIFILTHFCFLTIYSIGEILLITVQSIRINIRVHREIDEVEFRHSFNLLPFPVVLKRNRQRTIVCFLTDLGSQRNIIGTRYEFSRLLFTSVILNLFPVDLSSERYTRFIRHIHIMLRNGQ